MENSKGIELYKSLYFSAEYDGSGAGLDGLGPLKSLNYFTFD